jgi:hypothetical protein
MCSAAMRVLGCVGYHTVYVYCVVQDFYTFCMGRKIVCPPHKTKPMRRKGLKQINSCGNFLMQAIFKTKRFCIAFFYRVVHS